MIMIAKVQKYECEKISKEVDELIALTSDHDNFAIVKKMKAIVPEYKSQNSIYEKLD
jgi:hypothetical protein